MNVMGVVGGKAIISLIQVINEIILFIPAASVINVTLLSPQSTRSRYFCKHYSVRDFEVCHASYVDSWCAPNSGVPVQ